MKKTYIHPTITVVKLQMQSALMQASVMSIESNVNFDEVITGGAGEARTREVNVWEEEW